MEAKDTVLSREVIVGDLADALGVDAQSIGDQDDVVDLGLDSVRLMSLLEKWRAAGADHIDFVSLSSDARVGAWVDLLVTGPGTGE